MESRMPLEILELLIKAILQDHSLIQAVGLARVLCVCKRWLAVGTYLIWTDIALRSPQAVQKFASSPISSNHLITRSLTINLDPVTADQRPRVRFSEDTYIEGFAHINQHGSKETRSLWESLDALIPKLSAFHNLLSLSLFIRSALHHEAACGFWLRARDVCDIIEHLPDSVQHLELDTHGYEEQRKGPHDEHACHQLARRLPQLLDLRLRLKWVCKALFVSNAALRIRTLDLNLVQPYHWSDYELCDHRVDLQANRTPEFERERLEMLRKEVMNSLRPLASTSTLERLQIIEGDSIFGASRAPTIIRRDLLHDVTVTCPYNGVFRLDGKADADVCDIRLPIQPYVTAVQEDPSDKRADDGIAQDSVSYLVKPQDLDVLVEGPTWVETSGGARFPAAYAASQQGTKHDFLTGPKGVGFEGSQERNTLQQNNFDDLWERESEAGRWLLRARVSKGVTDDEPIFRERLESEKTPVEDEDSDDYFEDGGGDGEEL